MPSIQYVLRITLLVGAWRGSAFCTQVIATIIDDPNNDPRDSKLTFWLQFNWNGDGSVQHIDHFKGCFYSAKLLGFMARILHTKGVS